jgi:regulator of sirC expression with transglutaminase-like and TPR domain
MDLSATLEMLAAEPAAPVDLAEVALLIARDEYPHLDVEAYLKQLDGLAHEGRSYLGHSLESQVAGLCRFLFHDVGLAGNQKEYYDARNSFLNEVLDRLTGIPITLSLVTMAVGERLGMRISGVALPGHFVAMAARGAQRIVFDPFNQGRRLEGGDCRLVVRESAGVDVDLTLAALEPAAPAAIVTRVLTNLKSCYLRDADFSRAARVVRRLRQVVPGDLSQARDLGACYLQMGNPGKAINAFTVYLEQAPAALDRKAVAKLLRKARSEVARWN